MKGGNEEEMKDGDTKTNERRKMMIVDMFSSSIFSQFLILVN